MSGLNFGKYSKISRRAQFIVIIFLCLVLTFFLASRNYSSAMQKLHDDIRHDATSQQRLASRELHQIRVHLISVQNFSQGTSRMNRQDFKNFSSPILAESRSLQAIAIIPKVSRADRAKYEAEARSGGLSTYQFKQLAKSGQLVEAGKRDFYYPVFFVEPRNAAVLAGLDLGFDKNMRAALQKACDTGAPTATNLMRLGLEDSLQNGILVCLPVYAKGQAASTVDQRRGALLGFVAGIFSPERLIASAGSGGQALQIALLDESVSSTPVETDDKPQAKGYGMLWPQRLPVNDFAQEHPLLFGDRNWRMVITPTDYYLHQHFQPSPWRIVLNGLLLTIVVAGLAAYRLFRPQLSFGERIRGQADDAQGDSIYRPLFEQSRYGIIMCDLSWSILNANEAFLNLTGFTREDLEMLTVRDFTPPSWHALEDNVIRSQVLPLGFSGLYEKEFQRADGTTFKAVLQTWLMKDAESGDPIGLTTWVEESSGKEIAAAKAARLAVERLESMQRIAQYSSDALQDLYDIALEEALRISGSSIGHIYSYSEEKQELTLNSWSKEVMNDCFVLNKQTTYRLGTTGLWGESIRRRAIVLVNDYNAPHAAKMGLPPGHLPIKNFLSIPLIMKKRIVGLIGVANKKDGDYDEDDVRELTLLMHTLWHNVDRKRVEDSLHELEKQYRILSENTRDAVWKLDMVTGRFTFMSPSIERLTGYKPLDALGLPPEKMFAPSSHDFLKESLPARIKAFQAGEKFMGVQVYLLEQMHREGYAIPVEVYSTLVPNARGEVIEIIGVSRDMTDRIQNEHALNESNHMMRNLFDLLPQGIAWKNSDLVYLGCNAAFARLAGLQTQDDIMGRDDTLMPWLASAEALQQSAMISIATGTPAHQDITVKDNNGAQISISMDILPLKDSEGAVSGVAAITGEVPASIGPALSSPPAREEQATGEETEPAEEEL